MSDRFQPRGAKGQIPRRDPAEIEAQLRSRDRSAIDAHLRERGRPLSRERAAATLERSVAAHDTRNAQGRARNRGGTRRRAIILAILVALIIVSLVALPPLSGHVFRALADSNPDLIRIGPIADAVGATIGDRPDQPAGTDPTVVEFKIEPGAGSDEITQSLFDRELVTDRVAFTWVLISGGVINNLQAGTHELNRTMTPRQVSQELAGDPIPGGTGVPVVLRQGLRVEQIVAYLQTLSFQNLDIEQFKDLAMDPPAEVRAKFEWLRVVPEGQSVEGFMGSGVFDVDANLDAAGMLDVLLTRWEDSPSYQLIAAAESQGKDFYSTVILASIVEREAILDEDRALIAGVYQNRLDGLNGVRVLNAEPVLIYAKDTIELRERHISEWPQYYFWALDGLGSAANFVVPPDLEGYQVWHSRGLPPGPICTPGLASLEAALNPNTADGYLYFLAKGDGSNGHVFAHTYEEHQQNIRNYWGTDETPTPALPTAVPAS